MKCLHSSVILIKERALSLSRYIFVSNVLVPNAFGPEMNLGSNSDFTNCAVG